MSAGDHHGNAERLHEYWVHGEGAAKIRWGQPGDFDRCVRHLGKFIADPKGYCDLAHHAALGMYPATHAKMEGKRAVTVAERAEMTAASINDLPDSEFAYIEPGGKKDASGKTTPRSLRHFPVHDAPHVRNALARAPQSPFGDKAMPKIRAAAKKFGVDAGGDSGDSGSRSEQAYHPAFFRHSVPLDDIRILTRADGSTSGRVVEAFATVFNRPTAIDDFEGQYSEVIDPAAFNKTLSDMRRSRGGLAAVKVLFNHGLSAQGTPAPEFSKPIGVPIMIEPDPMGLLTRTEYNNTTHAEEVLELIRSGSITAQSFTGRIVRSDPQSRRGHKHRPDANGLPLVRRMELGLREYGPVLWPAYSDAEILGVRMAPPISYEPVYEEEQEEEPSTSIEEGAAATEPLEEHSAGHSALVSRMRALTATHRGIDWRRGTERGISAGDH